MIEIEKNAPQFIAFLTKTGNDIIQILGRIINGDGFDENSQELKDLYKSFQNQQDNKTE